MNAKSNDMPWRSGCPISSALDVIGDRWSLLIVRDLAISGPRTFSELRDSPEAIATNILAARLKLLSRLDIIQRVDPDRAARGNAYQLTERGAALRPALNELFRWSQTHLADQHLGLHLEPRTL